MYEIIDITFLLKSLIPKDVKVNFTIDDVRIKSNLTTNKAIGLTKKSFLCYFRFYSLSFKQSR